jgi:hypothetical protein
MATWSPCVPSLTFRSVEGFLCHLMCKLCGISLEANPSLYVIFLCHPNTNMRSVQTSEVEATLATPYIRPWKASRSICKNIRHLLRCRIWGSHSSGHEEFLFHAGFLLGLFFDPVDGGNMFLRNVGWPSTGYTALFPGIFMCSVKQQLGLLECLIISSENNDGLSEM